LWGNSSLLSCQHETGIACADEIVPNRHSLTTNSQVTRLARAVDVRSQHCKPGERPAARDGRRALKPQDGRVSLSAVLLNWAALVALWALPYLTLLDHLRPDAARSEILEWSLLIIGALGLVSLLYSAWRETLDPAWRARHGFPPRKRHRHPIEHLKLNRIRE
jgi:hypothetical protein